MISTSSTIQATRTLTLVLAGVMHQRCCSPFGVLKTSSFQLACFVICFGCRKGLVGWGYALLLVLRLLRDSMISTFGAIQATRTLTSVLADSMHQHCCLPSGYSWSWSFETAYLPQGFSAPAPCRPPGVIFVQDLCLVPRILVTAGLHVRHD
jgi:hypothetical protein